MKNLFFKTTVLAILVLSGSHGFSKQDAPKLFHVQGDEYWASKSGLTEEIVHKMRLRDGAADESDEQIDLLDSTSLRHRKQVLLVTSGGNGHCLALFVFQKHAPYDLVWSMHEFTTG